VFVSVRCWLDVHARSVVAWWFGQQCTGQINSQRVGFVRGGCLGRGAGKCPTRTRLAGWKA